jgi:taurine dioxygenase
VHPSQGKAHLDGYPDILVISTKTENGRDIGIRKAGPKWHSVLVYRERPALGSMLYALELPSHRGNTGFANMYKAHDALPAKLKNALQGKRTMFHSTRPEIDALHPILRTHPESGRKSIFVNPQLTTGTEGMAQAHADALLAEVYAHNSGAEFIYWHQWRPGDLTFWDNRCVQHIADHTRLDDPHYIRHTHRTIIAGDVPF